MTSSPSHPDQRNLVRSLLQKDARALAMEIAPGGRLEAGGREWRAPNPWRGEAKNSGSFVVWLTGEAAGGWKEFDAGEGEKGDVFDLIIRAGLATDFAGVMAWARARYDLPGPGGRGEDPGLSEAQRAAQREAAMARAQDAARERAALTEAEEAERRVARIAHAQEVWARARPLNPDGPVMAYLTAPKAQGGRGIARAAVERADLREARVLKHRGRDGVVTRWPAMIAAMRDPHDQVTAVHRTWVRPDAPGKAPVSPAKMMLGVSAGAVIVLARGVNNGLRGDLTEILCEGIEDGLHLAAAAPQARVLAVGSIGGLERFHPLVHGAVSLRVLVADNDWAGGPAGKAFERAAARIAQIGGRQTATRVVRMPAGKDADDFVNRGAAAPRV